MKAIALLAVALFALMLSAANASREQLICDNDARCHLNFSNAVAISVHAHTHRQHHLNARAARLDGNGNQSCRNNTIRVSTAYGISICVDARFASKFQAFFASLKQRGCQVHQIVCQAYGHAPGSNHIGGGACDVDQRARNRTNSCMYHAADLIHAAGLYDGCSFRDCGHVEAMRGLGNYGTRSLAARRHHHRRYALR